MNEGTYVPRIDDRDGHVYMFNLTCINACMNAYVCCDSFQKYKRDRFQTFWTGSGNDFVTEHFEILTPSLLITFQYYCSEGHGRGKGSLGVSAWPGILFLLLLF